MNINKDTIVCASFAKQAGNFGSMIHNLAARYYSLDFIYKSFSVSNIKDAIFAMKTLGFRGASITMPYKIEVLDYVDDMTEEVKEIGAANTIINENGRLTAHNTDWKAAYLKLKSLPNKDLIILGSGGYSKSIIYASSKLEINTTFVTRNNWKLDFKDKIVYNCTPLNDLHLDDSNIFIDCHIDTRTGKELALLQAAEQFELYTGRIFPVEWIKRNII